LPHRELDWILLAQARTYHGRSGDYDGADGDEDRYEKQRKEEARSQNTAVGEVG